MVPISGQYNYTINHKGNKTDNINEYKKTKA